MATKVIVITFRPNSNKATVMIIYLKKKKNGCHNILETNSNGAVPEVVRDPWPIFCMVGPPDHGARTWSDR